MEHGHVHYTWNSSITIVKGKWTIKIEFTFENFITLKDAYYVLEIKKNHVFGSLMNKFGFKLIFQSNTFKVTKKVNFMGNGF